MLLNVMYFYLMFLLVSVINYIAFGSLLVHYALK